MRSFSVMTSCAHVSGETRLPAAGDSAPRCLRRPCWSARMSTGVAAHRDGPCARWTGRLAGVVNPDQARVVGAVHHRAPDEDELSGAELGGGDLLARVADLGTAGEVPGPGRAILSRDGDSR